MSLLRDANVKQERHSPQETSSAFALILSVFVFVFSQLIYPIMFGVFPIYVVLSCLLCSLPFFFNLKKTSNFISHTGEIHSIFVANFIVFKPYLKSSALFT